MSEIGFVPVWYNPKVCLEGIPTRQHEATTAGWSSL